MAGRDAVIHLAATDFDVGGSRGPDGCRAPNSSPIRQYRTNLRTLFGVAGFPNLAMMVDREPTSNADFRMAMKHAVDREKIVRSVLKGYGSIGNDHPISPTDHYFCEDIAQREYDPDKARHHIRKAGLENVPVDFHASDVPGAGALAACQVVQQTAAAAGIDYPHQVSGGQLQRMMAAMAMICDPRHRPVARRRNRTAGKGGRRRLCCGFPASPPATAVPANISRCAT